MKKLLGDANPASEINLSLYLLKPRDHTLKSPRIYSAHAFSDIKNRVSQHLLLVCDSNPTGALHSLLVRCKNKQHKTSEFYVL
jgi:hypothetical protein